MKDGKWAAIEIRNRKSLVQDKRWTPRHCRDLYTRIKHFFIIQVRTSVVMEVFLGKHTTLYRLKNKYKLYGEQGRIEAVQMTVVVASGAQ